MSTSTENCHAQELSPYGERCQIKALLSRGDSIREIARYLGRSAATISRETGGDTGTGLRRRGKKPDWPAFRPDHIPDRVDIAERSAEAEEKSRIGDWELDTIISEMHRGSLLSSVGRMSKHAILEPLASRAEAPMTETLLRRMGAHWNRVHTLTADNGKELAGHREISAGPGAGLCLATPGSVTRTRSPVAWCASTFARPESRRKKCGR